MKNFKITHVLVLCLIFNLSTSLFLFNYFSNENVALSKDIGNLNQAFSKNIEYLTNEVNNANDVVNNLKYYILSKKATADINVMMSKTVTEKIKQLI